MPIRYRSGILLLTAFLAPLTGCVDRATAPPATQTGAALAARNPSALVPFDLGTLGGPSVARTSEAHGINPTGEIVGWSVIPGVDYPFEHATLWRDGTITDLGTFGGHVSKAYGINPDGVIVGGALIPGDYFFNAFVWRDGVMTNLTTASGDGFNYINSIAYGINPSGRIVGVSRASGADHAVLWADGTMLDLGTLGGRTSVANAINAAGTIVGSSLTAAGDEHAFVWENGAMRDLGTLGGSRSVAWAINAPGDIVGSSTTSEGAEHAVLWRKGLILDLGTMGRPTSVARGINASGQIVGYFSGAPGSGAFLWQNGGMTQLPSALGDPPPEPLGPGPAHAYAISPSGDIVGDGRGEAATHAALWTRK